jgi:lysophospholipase L1-like esterase
VLGCAVIRGDAYIGSRWHPNAAARDRWADTWPEVIQRQQAEITQAHQDTVTVVDLHAYLNPNGEFVNAIAGVEPIRGDGIHFSSQGADVVARWLAPRFVRIARQEQELLATANASVGT